MSMKPGRERLRDMIFSVADFFAMTLKREHGSPGRLTGKTEYPVCIFDGLTWKLSPRIAQSGVYADYFRVAALVHVAEQLYLLMLVEGDNAGTDKTLLFVLDGDRLSWPTNKPPNMFASAFWSRAQVYRDIVDGVVAGYTKSAGSPWAVWRNVRADLAAYIEKKKQAYDSVEDPRGHYLTEKYRTVGPRGV